MDYGRVLDFWKSMKISSAEELSLALSSFSVSFAYNSCRIENEGINYHDVREVFSRDGVTPYTGSVRTLFEVQNSKAAYERLLEAFAVREPVTEGFIKELQGILTLGTYDGRRYSLGERPGEYKKRDYVTGKNEVGASPEDVSEEMGELTAELRDITPENALITAAYFHAKLENIHPFSDGNGRVGRLVSNYILLLGNHPPLVFFEEDRKAYYAALESFDTELDLKPLTEFFKGQLIKTWEKRLDRESPPPSSLSDYL